MLGFFVGVLAIPKAIELANRVLEEIVIPRLELKKGAKGKMTFFPVPMDLALTPEEMQKLQQCGAQDILQAAAHRHHALERAGQANVCKHCRRLHP